MPEPNTAPPKNRLVTRRATALVLEFHIIALVLVPFFDALVDGGPRWHLAEVAILGSLNVTVLVPAVVGGSFLLRDLLFGGTSPGKRLVGLRVVRPNGDNRIGLGPALLRSLPLAFPVFGCLVEFVVASRSPGHRRLGDRLADTQVVEARPAFAKLPWDALFLAALFGGGAVRSMLGPSLAAWFQSVL
jgi:uncharacterized RDD family membrane protein YckC